MRCAVIGQNPMRFPWGFDEEDDRCRKLKMELAQQIMALRQSGVSQFLTACDCGVGLYAGEIVNGLRATTDHDLMLICYTPHEEQATKWAPYLRERYFDMLTACTYLSAVCEAGAPGAQLRTYKKIIDLADVVLAVYDRDTPPADSAEDRALAYAESLEKPLVLLHPTEPDKRRKIVADGRGFPCNSGFSVLYCRLTTEKTDGAPGTTTTPGSGMG